jgi:hypothetical protein
LSIESITCIFSSLMAEKNAAAIKMSEAAAASARRKGELMEELLELSRQDAKEEFEAERNKIEKRKAAMIRRKEDLLESSRQDAKQEFEAGRKTIMDRVPDQYKNRFGEVSFAKWGMRIRPVLIVSPYDVPMGPDSPREQWLGMFERVSSLVRNDSAQNRRPSSGRDSGSRKHRSFFFYSLRSKVGSKL